MFEASFSDEEPSEGALILTVEELIPKSVGSIATISSVVHEEQIYIVG